MIRFAEWRRPVDAAYAFHLRPPAPVGPTPPVRDVRDVAAAVLEPADAARFSDRVVRWSGPEDRDPAGAQPYASPQLTFAERPPGRLRPADLERVLAGTALVVREGPRTDYVLRDHHVLDVVLDHYHTTGTLPRGLFHADRHSDWCTDGFLQACRPPQAATWWALLPGLKRPGGAAVLREEDVVFTSASPPAPTSGRDVGAATRIPGATDRADLPWPRALARLAEVPVDWVSLDLDDFQPAAQLRLTRGLLRDPRFHALLGAATARIFVVSPQFTDGGDVVHPWTVRGSRASSLRLLNLLRATGPGGPTPRP